MILDNVPSETSQKPAPLCPVGKSAPQMKVLHLKMSHVVCCFNNLTIKSNTFKVYCLVFLSQLKTSEPGLQVRLRPGDKGPGRQPAGRLVQRIISMCYIWIMLYNMHILLGGFANFVQLLLMLIFMTQVVSSPWPTMASRSWRRDGASLRTSRFLLDLAIWVTNILGNY